MTKKRLSEIVAREVSYFHRNPSMRCSTTTRCTYSGSTLNKDTKGCLVGRLLPKALRLKADKLEVGSVCGLIHELKDEVPKYIVKNEKLFGELQILHDIGVHWGEGGLSSQGLDYLRNIVCDYGLNEDPFYDQGIVI